MVLSFLKNIFYLIAIIGFPLIFSGCEFERCDRVTEIPYNLCTPYIQWKFYRFSEDSFYQIKVRNTVGLEDEYQISYFRTSPYYQNEPDKNCVSRYPLRLIFRHEGSFYLPEIFMNFRHDSSMILTADNQTIVYNLSTRKVIEVNGTSTVNKSGEFYKFNKIDTMTVDGKLLRDLFNFPNPAAAENGYPASLTNFYFHGNYGLVRLDQKNGIRWYFNIF